MALVFGTKISSILEKTGRETKISELHGLGVRTEDIGSRREKPPHRRPDNEKTGRETKRVISELHGLGVRNEDCQHIGSRREKPPHRRPDNEKTGRETKRVISELHGLSVRNEGCQHMPWTVSVVKRTEIVRSHSDDETEVQNVTVRLKKERF